MSTEKIIPVGDYLLVGMENDSKEESNALILNLNLREDNRGIVKAVGDKVNTDEDSTKISEGDKIIFTPGSGIKITNSDDSDMLLSVKQVIGLIKEGE